jgi:sn-glycerol 3-phosphate transport system substrate-binding protein
MIRSIRPASSRITMPKHKRYTPLLTLAFLALALVSPPAFAQVELHWWHAMSGANTGVITRLTEQFNASQTEYRIVPTYKGSYDDTLKAGVAAAELGRPPHILQVYEVGTTEMLAKRRIVKPAFELMREAGAQLDPKAYLPAVTGHYSAPGNGELLSLPFNTSTMVLWLNVDALRKAGVTENSLGTWPDVFAAARKLRRNGHPTCGFSNSWSTWAHLEQLSAWHDLPVATRANGLDGFDAVLVFNGPVQVRHLEALAELHKDRSYDYSGRTNVGEGRFIKGECAIFLGSSALYGLLLKQANFTWRAARMPIYPDVPGTPRNSLIGGASLWAMAGKSPSEDRGVARFFAFLSSPERQLQLYEESGYIPSLVAAAEMARRAVPDERSQALAVGLAELTSKEPTENSRGLRLGGMTELREIWSEEIEAALAGQKSAKAALDDAVGRGNKVLRRFEAGLPRL